MFQIDKKTIQLIGCRGETLRTSFAVTVDEDTTSLEVSSNNPTADIRAVKKWWQHGRGIGAAGKHLNEELLLKNAGLIETDEECSFLYDSKGEPHNLTGEGRTLPDDLRFHDSTELQSVKLKAGETQKFRLAVQVTDRPTSIVIRSNGFVEMLPVQIEVLPYALECPKQLIGMYYVQCLSDDPDPPLSERHAVSESRMRAELKLMREIGVDYPSLFYSSRYKGQARRQAMEIRKSLGFPTDKLFSLVNRVDEGSDDDLRHRVENMRLNFPDYTEHYLYGDEERPDLTPQQPKWDLCRKLGAKSWLAIRQSTAEQAAGYLDLALPEAIRNVPPTQKVINTIQDGGSEAGLYACPHIGQDAETWQIRRNYGWWAWAIGCDAIFPHAFRNHADNQHPLLDWSGDARTRPIVAGCPTTDGVIPTVQIESLADAVVDLQYIATLETAIDNAPLSRSVQRRQADAWLQCQRLAAEDFDNNAMDTVRLQAIYHILELI